MTGWTATIDGSANAMAISSGTTTTGAGAILPSPTNDNYVYTSQIGPGYSLLTQDFTVKSGVNKIFFDVAINNNGGAFYTPNSLVYSDFSLQNQQARFEILKPGASITTINPADIIVTAFQTHVGDPLTKNWTTYTVDISSVLAAYVGQKVIFRFSQIDNQGYFNLAIDNINVGLLQFGVSSLDTQASLAQSAMALRGIYDLQSISLNNNLNNDCTLFDKHGICTSLSGTQTNQSGGAGSDATNGTLTIAYRVSNYMRIGAYLDQTLNVNSATGVHLNNGSPAFGGFGVWNENVDGYGAQVRVAAGYSDKDMTVTRQVIDTSEAGTGKTNLTSYGASIVGSYAMWMPGDITFSPYAGLRYTKVKAGGYTEATSDSVTTPLTYSALSQNVTTALVGAKWTTHITDNAIAYASLGIEQDLKSNGGTYTATGLDGVTPIAFNSSTNRTRRTASVGSYYNLGHRQRVGANIAWSEQPFTSNSSTSLMVTYTASF